MKLIKSSYDNGANSFYYAAPLDKKLLDTSKIKPVNRAARRAIKSNRQPIKGNKK